MVLAMKSRIIFGLFALSILCGCNEQPVEENIPFEPIGDLYPAPTEDTEYELVEEVDLCGWNSILGHFPNGGAGDVSRYNYYNMGEEYYCGCEVVDPELKHTDIELGILLNGDMPFRALGGACYIWVVSYQGYASVLPSQATKDGFWEMDRIASLKNKGYANNGDYDRACRFNLHTSTRDKGDIDLIFDLRFFDRTTGKYYKSNTFHLVTVPNVVSIDGDGLDDYVVYNAKVEKM